MRRLSLIFVCLLASTSVIAAPQIQHWKTENGARVYFVPAPDLPIFDISVVFDAGGARDGDKAGVALLTNGMLSEGAGEWNSDQIAERFESVGANFGNESKRDMSVLSLRSLTEPAWMEKAVETFTTVINQPQFPQAAFDRETSRLLVGLERQKQSPDNVADRAFYNAVFANHPYRHQPEGTQESIKKITLADLKNFYKQYFVGNNAVIAIVGKLDRQQAEALANRVVGGLPAGQAAAKLPEVEPLTEEKEIKIDFPASQTMLMLGQPGMQRGDPDYFALYVGNHIFGGSGLVSLLSDEVREKRGLAYSSYSYFLPMKKPGPFVLSSQTRNEKAEQALSVMRDVLTAFVKNGPTDEQLLAAKRNLKGGFALRIDSNSKIVSYLSAIGFYQLPLDYLDQFIANIDAVTKQQVHDAFQRRVDVNKLVTVVVGGASDDTQQTQ